MLSLPSTRLTISRDHALDSIYADDTDTPSVIYTTVPASRETTRTRIKGDTGWSTVYNYTFILGKHFTVAIGDILADIDGSYVVRTVLYSSTHQRLLCTQV